MEIGDKKNHLTLIAYGKTKNYIKYGMFRCDCGKVKMMRIKQVENGEVKSCGKCRNEPKECLWNGDCDHCGADDCIARPTQCIKYQSRDHCNEWDITRACGKPIRGFTDLGGAKIVLHGKTIRFTEVREK